MRCAVTFSLTFPSRAQSSLASRRNTRRIPFGDYGQHSVDVPECWRHQSDCSIHIITTFNPVCTGDVADREQNGALRETNRRCCSHCNKTVLQSKHAGTSLTPEVTICHLCTCGAKGLTSVIRNNHIPPVHAMLGIVRSRLGTVFFPFVALK